MRLSFGWSLAFALTPAVAAEPSGAAIYKAKCGFCHGPAGEGTKKAPSRLEGDRSPAQLADLIRKTMPEDDPESLTPTEAAAVAGYVHASFYSPVARERNRPARVELARLTARQHKNALADIVAGFRGQPYWGPERGLKGSYYKKRNHDPAARVAERTDPRVAFDFGTDAPIPDKMEPHEFAVRWTGSLLAPETGEYEFTVRTEHAARLWVNDQTRPAVDAWVKSGADTDHKGTIYLIGGHVYPVRLEFSKAKQGVNDSKKNPPKPTRSSISLLWAAPHRPVEVVPDRHLSPNGAPERFANSTPFPPDDRSTGWERGTAVSKEWDAATTAAALEAAAYVAAHLDELAGTPAPPRRRSSKNVGNPSSISLDADGTQPADQERTKKVRAFAGRFAELAFRRPLGPDQVAVVDKLFAAASDPEAAVKRVVLWALKSPRFLFREVGGGPDAYDVAARLSFALWDSTPDSELLTAAGGGKLATGEQVRTQAARMLAMPAGRAKLHGFLLSWLKADGAHDLTKDADRFPGFDAAVAADLRTSLELFLDDGVWSEASDFRQLIRSDEVFVNGRLAGFYEAELPADAPFRKVSLDPGRRAGVLTHPYLMAAFSHGAESSPIHRGVFVARGLLGVALKPPPEAVAPLAADLHPSLSTRERVALQTNAVACSTCHGIINPLGFVLENFDAVGRFRETDRDKPVDPAGEYVTREGAKVPMAGARELAAFLADSDEAHAAFCEQMFHYYVQQPVRAYGPTAAADLRKKFAAGGFHVRNLVLDVATTAALTPRVKP